MPSSYFMKRVLGMPPACWAHIVDLADTSDTSGWFFIFFIYIFLFLPHRTLRSSVSFWREEWLVYFFYYIYIYLFLVGGGGGGLPFERSQEEWIYITDWSLSCYTIWSSQTLMGYHCECSWVIVHLLWQRRKKCVFDYSVDFLFVKRRAEMYYNLISHVEW